MESTLWDLRNFGAGSVGEAYLRVLFITMIVFWEYPLVLPYSLLLRAILGRTWRPDPQARPLHVLVVIPSLLRKRDELTSMMSTIQSVAQNGYPGPLTIVVSIDGNADAPPLYSELCAWADQQSWNTRTTLYVTGTPQRHSKAMAIHHGLSFVKELVASGELPAFPPVYVSTDADADLGPRALELIVYRLQRRNPITRVPPGAVAGALYVRGNNFWQGWRHFFTVAGQLNLQVARDYYVSNLARHNVRALPMNGLPGAFYCTWSEVFLAIPGFMGYARSLRARDWFRWWTGVVPPTFSGTDAKPLPERVAGDTDDTVTAYVATIARYRGGRFTFDPPPTPLHALYEMLWVTVLSRPIQFEPRARVYTSSPTTIKALFKQRKRWNTARIELTMRFWRIIAYHWALGGPALIVKSQMVKAVIVGGLAYLYLPFFVNGRHLLTLLVLGYCGQLVITGVLAVLAMLMNDEFDQWRLLLALPLSPVYGFCFKWLPGATGAICDVLLFGNVTGFAPEWTLVRGQSVRIALLFRLRRAFALAVRSVTCGDVPLGSFWFGWNETPWTPHGYEGWTTGKKAHRIIPPPSAWFRS